MAEAGERERVEVAREGVAEASRRLALEGLVVGTAGNVSQRVDELVAITPTGASLASLSAEEIAVVDLEGRHVQGKLEPSSELHLHLGVYNRHGAGAVVHTHSLMATALSCVIDELPVVHYQMLLLGGPVRVAPYATFGSPELAELTVEALHERTAALMANHGAIVQGPKLGFAVEQSMLLEWACSVYWHAATIGAPRALDPDQRTAVIEAAVRRGYGAPRTRSQ
jgi:L-fuculose-phosphate aldolase